MTNRRRAQPTVLGRTFAELDLLAKEAVQRATQRLRQKGVPTFHLDEAGQMIETLPDGTCRPAHSDGPARR